MSAMRMGRRDFLRVRLAPSVVGTASGEATTASESGVRPRDIAGASDGTPPFLRRARAAAGMGTLPRLARIDRFACLASTGQVCTTCLEHCPEPGALRLDGLVPSVDSDKCTGCGVCEPVCPAPGGAIRVLPLLDRRNP
jgi:Pyruvate/2-oxoacid:ferredoxin oxidoreductase delta subunit